MFQLKYFEPVWGENKSSNSNAPVTEWSNVKHKKPKPAAVSVTNSTVTSDVTLRTTAKAPCSSSDDIKNKDIQLKLPWDSVDSSTDITMKPLEEVILPSVNNFILYYYFGVDII